MTDSLPSRQDAVEVAGDRPVERSSAGDAFSDLVIQVFQLNGLLIAAGDALARPVGQTSARWQVLAAAEDAPATVAQIARSLHLARQSVQRVADLLVEEGLAEYEDNPEHRRAKLLALTPAGRSTLRAIQIAQARWADVMGADIGEAQLRRASAILARTLSAVRSPRPGRGRS